MARRFETEEEQHRRLRRELVLMVDSPQECQSPIEALKACDPDERAKVFKKLRKLMMARLPLPTRNDAAAKILWEFRDPEVIRFHFRKIKEGWSDSERGVGFSFLKDLPSEIRRLCGDQFVEQIRSEFIREFLWVKQTFWWKWPTCSRTSNFERNKFCRFTSEWRIDFVSRSIELWNDERVPAELNLLSADLPLEAIQLPHWQTCLSVFEKSDQSELQVSHAIIAATRLISSPDPTIASAAAKFVHEHLPWDHPDKWAAHSETIIEIISQPGAMDVDVAIKLLGITSRLGERHRILEWMARHDLSNFTKFAAPFLRAIEPRELVPALPDESTCDELRIHQRSLVSRIGRLYEGAENFDVVTFLRSLQWSNPNFLEPNYGYARHLALACLRVEGDGIKAALELADKLSPSEQGLIRSFRNGNLGQALIDRLHELGLGRRISNKVASRISQEAWSSGGHLWWYNVLKAAKIFVSGVCDKDDSRIGRPDRFLKELAKAVLGKLEVTSVTQLRHPGSIESRLRDGAAYHITVEFACDGRGYSCDVPILQRGFYDTRMVATQLNEILEANQIQERFLYCESIGSFFLFGASESIHQLAAEYGWTVRELR